MTNPVIVLNFINGKWQSDNQTEWFTSLNPTNGEVVGKCVMSSEKDVNEAVNAAKDAFASWKRTPAPERAEYLWKVAAILEERKQQIAALMTLEMGKVLSETIGEVNATIASCKYMAGEGRRMFGETIPSGSPDRSVHTVREPLGVVACITPWNYPIALAAYKIFAALIAGNAVVWKPASDVAASAKIFTEVLESAGLPAGVLNLVLGSGSKVGQLLVKHNDVKVIAFTGSTEVGKQLAEVAGRYLKRVSLELGGKNAIIVLRDADLDKAAEGIVKTAFGTTGQRCTAAGLVIVESDVAKELIQRIVHLTENLKIGDGLKQGTDVGPLANEAQFETVKKYMSIAQEEGCQIVTGGTALTDGEYAKGFFFKPTVITGVSPHHRIVKEEIFGPILPIIIVSDFDEAVKINNQTEYGLSSAIYTTNLHYANRAAKEFESGLVYINSGTSNAEIGVPFGGYKSSGNGHREVSRHALDVMTEWKTIYTNY
jgi:acyl-CoA reductase-like NAD-dependent aldehyde dehydrogenase